MDPQALALAALGVFLGGFLKGATGVGAPVIGVPVLAILLGVPGAVAIFAVVNLLSNAWQSHAFRKHLGPRRFYLGFAAAGALGAVIGSVLLVALPVKALMLTLAGLVWAYIGLRLTRPDWSLSRATGTRFAGWAGFTGGILQGAGGLSAPVSLTFLNAMRLDRQEFVATISVYFMSLSVLQIPALIWLGVLDVRIFALGVLTAIPLFIGIPVGAFAARFLSKDWFDRAILALLGALGLGLAWKALS